jgi:hypothetical protein
MGTTCDYQYNLGFSAVMGIGKSLVWPSQGDIWKKNNFFSMWLF